jgi:stage II sporulation protein D
MQRSPRIAAAVTAAAALLCAAPAAHGADGTLVIRGAGFGHGVGMSQYGALGMARAGWDHRRILAHYYTGTALGTVDPGRPVRVLLGGRGGVTRFTGASAAGDRALKPGSTYGARARADGRVDLLSSTGRRLKALPAPLRLTGPVPVAIEGRGAYRGTLELHPGGGGLDVVNTVGLDDYVRGVVSRESPASWPAEALEAQAVAARTYAITTVKGVSPAWDHYADTRSQVYGGVGAETPTTDAAVAATAGQVVTHGGRPVVTYFFSTSGGRTEDVENSLGGTPQPWLRSVQDPHDAVSPRHRWKPQRLTLTQAERKLRGLVKGRLRGIEVVRRGRSPRIVAADVVGSGGRTRVTGATLRLRFGLYDTWAYFTAITADERPPAEGEATPPPQQLDPTGGANATPARLSAVRPRGVIAGRVVGVRSGTAVVVQRRRDGRWQDADLGRVRDGRYRVAVRHRGLYRVQVGSVTGPVVRVSGR